MRCTVCHGDVVQELTTFGFLHWIHALTQRVASEYPHFHCAIPDYELATR